MKVTMLTTLAGPSGNASPGTVLDLPEKEAQEYVARRFARPFDRDRDRKAKVGLEKAKEPEGK